MARSNYQRMKFRPVRAYGIEIAPLSMHPSYELRVEESAEVGKTGLLRLFALVPSETSYPTFLGRYDAKDGLSARTDSSAIDVDVEGLSRSDETMFKAGRDGFTGHHSLKLPDGTHSLLIATPMLGPVFEAVLKLGADVSAEATEVCSLEIQDSFRVFVEENGEELLSSTSKRPAGAGE